MADQAENLRQLVHHNQITGQKKEPRPVKKMQIITVTSGKGGVGKSSFAVNFAIALAQQGKKVLLLDADFGLANIDIMMGIVTRNNLSQVISGEKKLEDIITTGHNGVRFISGGSGMEALLTVDNLELEQVMQQLTALEEEIDILIIDTGAGVNNQVLKMISASDEVIMVMTPEPTSMMDSFALTKAVSKKLGKDKDIRLVVNRAETRREAEATATSFANIVEKYLGIEVKCVGSVSMDKAVPEAVKLQVPYMISWAHSTAAKDIQEITKRYLNIVPKPKGIRRFLQILRGENQGAEQKGNDAKI